jgi:putative DNA primase/helicase
MQDLLGFATERGFSLPNLTLDGNIHRFNRQGTKNAWYVGWTTNRLKGSGQFITAVIGDWKTGEHHEFKNTSGLSKAESKIYADMLKEAKEKAEAERATMQDDAARRAKELYNSGSKKAANSEYLERKKITGLFGATSQLEDSGRTVYVPIYDVDMDIRGLQRIYENGDKRFITGQKNHGNFALVGTLDGADLVYLCEGWATGVTIHMATGKPAICAMSAGNLLPVARNVKKKWPSLNMVVCGDSDDVGRAKAQETAEAVMTRSVFPSCPQGGTDFNDLYIETSLDNVRDVLTPVNNLGDNRTGFVALGHAANNSAYYFYKQTTSSIIEIRYFSDNDFLKLQPSTLWDVQFPAPKSGFNKKEATDYLIGMSEKAGIFNPTKQRGPGCWRDRQEFIYNPGKKLFNNFGEELGNYRSSYVYTNASFSMRDTPGKPLPDAESSFLVDACEAFRWKDDHTGKLLAGWLALARVASLLPKRYHVWLTGPSDTGKTDVMEKLVRFAIGEDAHAYFKGSTTEAGVRQTVNNSTRPVVFDELESDGQSSIDRVTSIVDLLRIAYDGGTVTKGSTLGHAHDFVAAFPAIVSSIRMALDNDADRSRFFQVELKPLLKNQTERAAHYNALLKKVERIHAIDDYAERLFWRSFRNIETIIWNYAKLKTAFSSHCQKSRTVSLYAILSAGHYSLLDTGRISDGAAEDYASGLDFGEEPEADENMCLGHLLATKLRTIDARAKGMTDAIVYEEYTVGELAEKSANSIELSHDQQKAMERFGVKVYKNYLCVNKNSATIKTRYKDSKWAKSFADVLTRVSENRTIPLRFNGKMDRTIPIPLTLFHSTND